MSRELPYFKFFTSEWNNGDITLEDYNVQGVFLNVCAYYWDKECSVSLNNIRRKFKNAVEEIDTLIASNIIKVDKQKNIVINFLNEQLEERESLKKVMSENGKKGGRPPKIKPIESQNKPIALFEESQSIAETSNIEKEEEKNKKREEGEGKNAHALTPPLVSDVELFFKDKMQITFWSFDKCKSEAIAFFEYYDKTSWRTKSGPITNWHSAAAGWIRNDGKFESEKATKILPMGKSFPAHYNKKYMEDLATPELKKKYRDHLNSIGLFFIGHAPNGDSIWGPKP